MFSSSLAPQPQLIPQRSKQSPRQDLPPVSPTAKKNTLGSMSRNQRCTNRQQPGHSAVVTLATDENETVAVSHGLNGPSNSRQVKITLLLLRSAQASSCKLHKDVYLTYLAMSLILSKYRLRNSCFKATQGRPAAFDSCDLAGPTAAPMNRPASLLVIPLSPIGGRSRQQDLVSRAGHSTISRQR